MKVPFVDLHAQYLTIRQEIDAAIASVIAQSDYIRGPNVEGFETEWAKTIGRNRCVSCANGTDALYIAQRGLGVKLGDEVVTTAHSWISTSETITQAGGRVVFCDTDRETFTIDPGIVESKISPRTVGIIPVHLFGQPADMGAIMRIAEKHGLWVIEDCAQSHLARFSGRMTGSFGRAATYSFYPGKNLGAYGDAGCLVTNDADLADWCALYARHGGKGEHVIEGLNSRLDGLQAAILRVKLPHLDSWTRSRQRVAAAYDAGLRGVGDIRTPTVAPERTHVYHLYVVRTAFREALKRFLGERQISTAVNYPRALPFCPAYAYLGTRDGEFPVAREHQDTILSLPIYPEISELQIEHVVSSIREFFSGGGFR